MPEKTDVWQGTLALMVLKTLRMPMVRFASMPSGSSKCSGTYRRETRPRSSST